jgi:hypothetical protein
MSILSSTKSGKDAILITEAFFLSKGFKWNEQLSMWRYKDCDFNIWSVNTYDIENTEIAQPRYIKFEVIFNKFNKQKGFHQRFKLWVTTVKELELFINLLEEKDLKKRDIIKDKLISRSKLVYPLNN